ncbi:ZmpA/ZmpB/ZmpC family metallo-endopeptidase [Streptococcus hohhotensis]|uniref:ZmpA/ZmpB/ZmpC family metallo-endopeptidase n=1 Tax=Streptococcus hohhotensis TaxID=2866998 RepID=A0ABT6QE33_9STRE|nr:ZmpA/ZmpB/ZmpC family metallo-endopeptidase [Streptococcus sp. IMAU 99199]MDI2139735.1 ZmpA/ZmpB/ZmpC family metallo-endopeptidase [Streptococcus sp. IMAU 99199]
MQWFEENKIEVKEGKEYYFVYRKLATRLPETGLFSNDEMFILGAGLLLLSFTLIKRKKGASYFLVTVFAVGGWGASISAFENLVELQPALVKRVEGQFLPSPERVQGYEFTGYYLVRDSASKELSVDKVESPALSQKEESSESQSKKIVPQLASHFSSTEDLVQSPQPSYAVEPVLNPTSEKSMSIESKKVPDEGMKTVIEDKPELEVRVGEIEFETQLQSDPTLAKGEKRISIEGAKGQERILTEVRVVDGIVTRNEVGREVLREPVAQVILVGAKEKEPQENGISLAPEVQPPLPSYEGGVSGESLVEPSLPSYEGGVSGESLVEPALPSYEGGVSGEPSVEPSLPSYEGGVSGESLVEPSLPSYEGGVSGESLVEPSLPSYEGGVSGESLVEPALPSYEGGVSGESLVEPSLSSYEGGVSGDPSVEPSLPSYEGGVSGETLVEPSLSSYEGGVSGESLVEPSLPSYEGGVSGDPSVEPSLPSYEGSVSGESLVEPSLPSYEGGVSGDPSVEPSLPSYEGGVSGEPEIQEALPEYKEDTQLPQTKVETKAVPYETVYEKNEKLDHGVTRVKIPGVEGQEQVTTTYTKDQASGNISENKTVKIVVNKVDQVVEVGTKPSVETTVLSHKTIYQVNPALEFRRQEVAVAGHDGSVETRTTYQLDKATGQVTVSDTTRQVNPAVDKVIQVGNVEKVIQPIAVTEERREDSSLAKNIEKVASEGEVGENTLTRTYAINEQTGELVNPQEVSQITKPMKPRVVLVGSQEDKPHLLPANSEREDAVDVSALTTSVRSVDFLNDSKLKEQLEPVYDPRDIITKRIALRKTHPNITDQEVKDMLRTEYLQKLSIQESFDQTKTQAESSFKKIASHTLGIIGDTPENRSKVKQELEQYKEQILLGLSYINRFYNIQFGDTNIRDILAFNPSSFGNKTMTALDSLKKLGSMSYEEMKLTNSPQTFTKYLSTITGKASLKEFLDSNRQLFTSDDADTWLKKSSQAMIVEKPSKENPSAHVGLYSKLTAGEKDPRKQEANMAAILGLLNVKEPNVYVISNMATITYGNIGSYIDTSLTQSNPTKYQAELARVKSLIEKAAVQQANYVDTLYRITKPENRDKLLTNRLIIDTMKKYTSNPNAQIDSTWSPATGNGADKGVDQFMTPMNYYSPVSKVGAEANGLGVRYFIDRVLDDRGSATYSHEMTHLLDRTVLFNNHGRRDGTGAEFYARGIFENSYNPEKDTYFNLNFVYDESDKNGFYNKTPDRFKTAEDLKSYMKGSFDVLYTLDYLEAEVSKGLSAEDKMSYFKKIMPIPSTGPRTWVDYRNTAVKPTHKSEEIQALTLEDAKKLTDIDSLIDNHILVNRYIIAGFSDKGKIAANGYYTVDMFDTIYGVSQNDSGMSGDITFRKQAFELMGALGYYEGFVPYASNQYKQAAEAENKPLSDTYIFNKILNGKSYAEFKKAQFKERVAKIDQLKALTIQYEGQQISLTSQKLSELMQKAVKEELAQIKAGNTTARTYTFIETPVQKLKKAIYKAYLKDSDDFRQSIYNS